MIPLRCNRRACRCLKLLVFTPGSLLKGMIKTVSIQKLELPDTETSTPPSGGRNEGGGENGGETPDPAA